MAAGRERVRGRIHEQALAGGVGSVDPPVEGIVTGTDGRNVPRAADAALIGEHRGFLADGERKPGRDEAVGHRHKRARGNQLPIPPAPLPKHEQTEAGEVAARKRQAAGAVVRPEGVEGVAVLELQRLRQPRAQDFGAVRTEDALGERVIIERQGEIVVGVGFAGPFGETVARRLRGEVTPGDCAVLAVVQRFETRLEIRHERVRTGQPVFLDSHPQKCRQKRLEGRGDFGAFSGVAPCEGEPAVANHAAASAYEIGKRRELFVRQAGVFGRTGLPLSSREYIVGRIRYCCRNLQPGKHGGCKDEAESLHCRAQW